ncbi:MAG: ABC transporter substrate-binding protein [Candidatus Aenigmarchaeota archaeon]|nr:ABC transporter substrate-binding protein [Candidatus Aenigmarchaeota archaeon]
MKKFYLAIPIIFVLLGALFILNQPTGQVTAREEVKVGAVLALTGDYGVFGTAMQRGIEIASEELNAGRDIRYKLIFEDDGNFEISRAVYASRKLVDVDNVDTAFVTAANEAKSISPIYEASKTPLIVLWDSNEELAGLGNYTFGIGFSTERAAGSMAEFSYNLGARNVSIVYTFDDWSNLISKSFQERFEALGGDITLFQGTDFYEKDFRAVITKSEKADAIYAPLLLPSRFLRQARELGFQGYLLSADSLGQDQIDAAQNAADGVYYTNVYAEENEKIRNILEKYRAKYDEEPNVLPLTAIGYDAMFAIDAAVRAKGIGREQIKDGLYEIEVEGATGQIDFDESGLSPRFERIFVVSDGKPVLVE